MGGFIDFLSTKLLIKALLLPIALVKTVVESFYLINFLIN